MGAARGPMPCTSSSSHLMATNSSSSVCTRSLRAPSRLCCRARASLQRTRLTRSTSERYHLMCYRRCASTSRTRCATQTARLRSPSSPLRQRLPSSCSWQQTSSTADAHFIIVLPPLK
uniref:Uncharacterized protein n=1 Tax=Rhipicephalus zambeziensis TaxID=60191 RepID=A0A224Z229_9ACAR